jgi:hypothetical protein
LLERLDEGGIVAVGPGFVELGFAELGLWELGFVKLGFGEPGFVDFVELDASTQYEYPSQKVISQSSETAGFSAMNLVCVILKAVSTEKHESPDLAVYHFRQFDAIPG